MIEVFFATNRNLLGADQNPEFGDRFHPDGPQFVRFGSALVERRDGPPFADNYVVRSVTIAEEIKASEADRQAGRGDVLGSHQVFSALRDRMRGGATDTIVLIHGFASGFRCSLERAAELKQKYTVNGVEPNVFVFSWPSDAKVEYTAYFSDRDDAKASAMAMARSFLKLREWLIREGRKNFCEQNIHLVAHSMGNYATRHAIQAVRAELGNNVPRLFDHVFLMAADEDNDAFEHDHKLRLLPDMAKHVHVYFSSGDRALTSSDLTKSNRDRLGTSGPRINDNISRKIVLVDCRHVDFTVVEHGRHQYYRLRPELIADVQAVLAGTPANLIANRDYIHDDRSFRIKAPLNETPRGPDIHPGGK